MIRSLNLFVVAAHLLLLFIVSCSTEPTGNSITTSPTLNIIVPEPVLKGSTVSFVVSLSTTNSVPVSFHYTTVDVTARADSDYIPTSGNATIPTGSTRDTIKVQTITNALNANGKSFKLVISAPVNGKLGRDAASCTIYENAELTVRDTVVVKGDTASIVVSLNIPNGDTVIFHYATADSSAIAGIDYDAVSDDDTLLIGVNTAVIRIPTRETLHSGKAFKLVISAAVGAAIVRSTASCRLTEIPNLSVADASPVPAGDTALFTVSLNKPRATAVIFHYTTSDSIAHAGSDYETTSGVDTIPPGATGSITRVPTRLGAQPDSNFVFKLAISDAEHATITQPTGVCRIAALPKLSVSDTVIVQGAFALFVVTLSEQPLSPVTFRYSTADSSALADVDYLPVTDGIAQISAGALSVVVPVLTKLEAPFATDKFFKLIISAPTHSAIDRATAICRIDQAGPPRSFLNDIRPILLTANCARNGCHGGGSSSGGLNLGSMSHADIRDGNGTNKSFLVPNSAETSRLYRVLTTRFMSPNTIRMPMEGATLSTGDQEKIRNWIDQGAKITDALT